MSVTTPAEDNFYVGFGGRLYYQRNEDANVMITLNGEHYPYRNGSYMLDEQIPVGFYPLVDTHLPAACLHNGKILSNVKVDFVLLKTGRILVNVEGLNQNLDRVKFCGQTTYKLHHDHFDK